MTVPSGRGDPRRRAHLESLLRSFEHDADVAAASGRRPMDVAWLREALGLDDGALLDMDVEGATAGR
jgi:hypothetical protein